MLKRYCHLVMYVCITVYTYDLHTHDRYLTIFSSQERFSFQLINVSSCYKPLTTFKTIVAVYVNLLITITTPLVFFNMNISSQFRAEGKITAATVLAVLSYGWIDLLIRFSLKQSNSPKTFRWEFYWSTVYIISIVLITGGCLHIQLVSFHDKL